jgi:hypothetical protein
MHHGRKRSVTTACLLLTSLCAVAVGMSGQQGTGSVTGRVTVDGRPAANTQILLAPSPKEGDNFLQRLMEPGETHKAVTDSEGHYRFNDLAAGAYEVKVFAPILVGDRSESRIRISDGETVESVDFALKTGGVVTGAVTLPDGRPAINQSVSVNIVTPPKETRSASPDVSSTEGWRSSPSVMTDDRGVYRIYGVAPGDYTVSVTYGGGRKESVQTYYPGATEQAKAGHVKVKAGAETSGIDFKLALSKKKGYEVRGRVIDEFGKPISGIMISCGPARDEGDEKAPSPIAPFSEMVHSNAQGEFKIPAVTQGKYTLSVMSMFDEASVYSDPVTFEVGNRDVDGVEVKTHKGLTASGIAVVEDNDDATVTAQLPQVQLMGMVMKGEQFNFSISKANLGADGSFVLRGLSPGKLNVMVNPMLPNSRFSILRIERGGAPQNDGVEITTDNPVTDIKLVLGYGNCTIYGRASLEGGTLPKGSSAYVHIKRQGGDAFQNQMDFAAMGMGRSGTVRTIEVSPGESFRAEGLVPGDYDVTLTTAKYWAPLPPGAGVKETDSTNQKVTLTSGGALEVNLKLDLSSNK